MWNPNSMSVDSPEDDDSWEVKAFAEDAGNAMGATWPPRSYTCTFCRREFRSAQALGGHMNVHRRDRARLHQAQVSLKNPNLAEELVGDSGVCLLFSLPNPNAIFKPTSLNHFSGNSSRILSLTPRPSANNLMNFPHSSNIEASASVDRKHNERISHDNEKKKKKTDLAVEGIDLELRLGCSSSGS